MSELKEILYSTNNDGIKFLSVSLYSLLKNKDNDTEYNITIAHNDISETNIELITKIGTKYKTNIRFVDCSKYDVQFGLKNIFKAEEYMLKLKWPSAMYYYFLASLFYKDVSIVLYLDIDTIVLKDLTNLFNVPSNSIIFAGTRCVVIKNYILFQKQRGDATKNKPLKEDSISTNFVYNNPNNYLDYINSGVLLINLEQLAKVDLNKLFIVAKEKNFNDQDLISYFFTDKLSNLALENNFCLHFFHDRYLEIHLILRELKPYKYIAESNDFSKYINIAHYTVYPKPVFFFNESTKFFIKKLNGDVRKFTYLLMDPNKYVKEFHLDLLFEQKNQLLNLAKTWIQKIHLDFKKTRVAEKAFIVWGQYWWEVEKLKISRY